MQGIFSRLFGYKKKMYPKMNCADFYSNRPQAPTLNEIQSEVLKKFDEGNTSAAGNSDGFNPQGVDSRTNAVRGMTFDIRYRCGAHGRCLCTKGIACRYPGCFTMRPSTKGAEILSERMLYEIDVPPVAGAKRIVELCRADNLPGAIHELRELVNSKIRRVAAARQLKDDVDVLASDSSLRDEVTPLLLWCAALMANLGHDERSVHLLLNAAKILPAAERVAVRGAAARWATLNDIEIIYYRALLVTHDEFPLAIKNARERPLMLRAVVDSVDRGDGNALRMIATIVLGQELSATAARGPLAQQHDDETEDPLKSATIPMTLSFYRWYVSEPFWEEFFSLLVLPPGDAPDGKKDENGLPLYDVNVDEIQQGITPPQIMDANVRVMYLHHLLRLTMERERDLQSGKIKLPKNLAEVPPNDIHKYALFLDPAAARKAQRRMRELLSVIRAHDRAILNVMKNSGADLEREAPWRSG